jgi:FMN-dependent NADH-azoreductase
VSFTNPIYRILIYKTELKYNTVFIIYTLEFKTEFALIIIGPYYNYLIYYFLFNYIDNFYKSREYIVCAFSL